MRVLITVTRMVQYSTIVEMDQSKFDDIEKTLDGGGSDMRATERYLDGLIDTHDWQDDEFYSLDAFEPLKETKQPLTP